MPRLPKDRLRLMSAYLRRRSTDLPGPSGLMVETTVRCNLLCPMCPRTGVAYPAESLPDELLFPLIEEHARIGGDHLYTYGLGEPLLDPRIFDLLERCRELDVDTILSTNGTLLDEDRRRKLLDSGCRHVIVGIDGVTEETYDYYRAGGNFARVVEHVRAFAAEKQRRRSSMTLVVQFIRMRRNLHEQQAFIDEWSGVDGVDTVRIKEEDIGIEEHRLYELDGYLRENACFLLWRGPMVVRHNGDVYPCYHIAENGEPLGNMADSSLEELWNSAEMERLRSLHGEGRWNEESMCKTCPCARPRLPWVLGAMALRGRTVRRWVPVAERIALRFPRLFSEQREECDLASQ